MVFPSKYEKQLFIALRRLRKKLRESEHSSWHNSVTPAFVKNLQVWQTQTRAKREWDMKGWHVLLCLHLFSSYSFPEILTKCSTPSEVFHPLSPGSSPLGFPRVLPTWRITAQGFLSEGISESEFQSCKEALAAWNQYFLNLVPFIFNFETVQQGSHSLLSPSFPRL